MSITLDHVTYRITGLWTDHKAGVVNMQLIHPVGSVSQYRVSIEEFSND